jgi:dienelactone hydrolase
MAPASLDFVTGVMYYPYELFVPFGPGPVVPAEVVSQVHVPLLGHFGAEDKNPSPADRERLDAALTQAGVPHTLYSYDGAPHGFAAKNAARPNFREAQAQVANDRTVDWFERHLRGAGVPA